MKTILSVLFLALFVLASAGETEMDLLFSSDHGATWTRDFPIVSTRRPEFLLKIVGKVREDPANIVNRDIGSRIWNSADFASARRGKTQFAGKTVYVQYPDRVRRLQPTLLEFEYKVNLGKREKEETGTPSGNKQKGSGIRRELPPCEAHRPGELYFTAMVSYAVRDRNTGKMKWNLAKAEFSVSIKGDVQ